MLLLLKIVNLWTYYQDLDSICLSLKMLYTHIVHFCFQSTFVDYLIPRSWTCDFDAMKARDQ